MSRLTYLLGVGITLVALAFLLTDHVLYSSRRIRLRDAQRIRLGMTIQEVEAIFGRSADQESRMGGVYIWEGIDNTAYVRVGLQNAVFAVHVWSNADQRCLMELRSPMQEVDLKEGLIDLLRRRPDLGWE